MSTPLPTKNGTSQKPAEVIAGTLNASAPPNTATLISVAVTEAMMTGMKEITEYSIITTSMAKMTPAIGVLKEADIAAAVPQPTSVRILLFGRRMRWPSTLAAAAPR